MSKAKSFKPVAVVASAVAVLLAALLVATMLGFGPLASKSERSLLKSVRNVSQYHAAVGDFQLLLDEREDTGGLPGFIAGRRTLFVAAGTVNAYVDLSGLAEEDVTVSADGKSVKVRLPEPQLDKPNIDHERSYVYSQDRGIADRVVDAFTAPQQEELYLLAESDMAEAAENSELRQRAGENTESMLTGLFASLGYEVTFEGVIGG